MERSKEERRAERVTDVEGHMLMARMFYLSTYQMATTREYNSKVYNSMSAASAA